MAIIHKFDLVSKSENTNTSWIKLGKLLYSKEVTDNLILVCNRMYNAASSDNFDKFLLASQTAIAEIQQLLAKNKCRYFIEFLIQEIDSDCLSKCIVMPTLSIVVESLTIKDAYFLAGCELQETAVNPWCGINCSLFCFTYMSAHSEVFTTTTTTNGKRAIVHNLNN